jgi:glycerol-1-phosphate dehydrogenase [NAD(P)+]
MMGLSFDCVCGRKHAIPIEYLAVRKGALGEVSAQMVIRGLKGKGGLIYDRKIERSVVGKISKFLRAQGIPLSSFPVGDGEEKLQPEVELSQRVAEGIDGDIDFLFSVGSGVISDLTKNAAAILGLPFFLIATAPSMNGYTSSMAALTDEGIKKTIMVPPAKAVFADLSVLMDSPVEMVRSGLGDIVSKSVCNADWKLSQLVKGTYFCPTPFRMTDRSEPLYLEAADEIRERTENGIYALTDGIMRSGLSMTIIGTSTPSSGAEHVISHYWDLVALMEGREKLFHGVQVGVATVIMLKLFDFIRNYPVRERVSLERLKREHRSKADLEEHIAGKFGEYAAGVREEYFQKYMDWKEKQIELERILDGWDGLWNELDPYIRPTGPVERALQRSGAASSYADLGKSRGEVCADIRESILIRGRYTVLDLAEDLGILGEAAERVL